MFIFRCSSVSLLFSAELNRKIHAACTRRQCTYTLHGINTHVANMMWIQPTTCTFKAAKSIQLLLNVSLFFFFFDSLLTFLLHQYDFVVYCAHIIVDTVAVAVNVFYVHFLAIDENYCKSSNIAKVFVMKALPLIHSNSLLGGIICHWICAIYKATINTSLNNTSLF